MKIEPDGLELLRAARIVVRSAIAPHIRRDRRDLLPPIERAITLGEDRLALDAQASAEDLAVLYEARAGMRGSILEALPEARRFDARLVAQAIAVAAQQLAHGRALERREYERLVVLLDAPAQPQDSRDGNDRLAALNSELCARIRAGDADAGTTMYGGTLAHLEATTREALAQSNPAPRRPGQPSGPPVRLEASAPLGRPDSSLCRTVVSAWGDVPRAAFNALIEAPSDGLSAPLGTWRDLRERVGDAVSASGNAAFAIPATVVGCLVQRLAANPDVPMVVVEGAHQAHDLSIAFAEASTAFWNLALAPFRRAQPRRFDLTKLP